jgi:hypothetical protein
VISDALCLYRNSLEVRLNWCPVGLSAIRWDLFAVHSPEITVMDKAQPAPYVLGHSEPELQRLIEQSRFYGELTEQFLRSAGLGAGMRVLDVGCGAGDV